MKQINIDKQQDEERLNQLLKMTEEILDIGTVREKLTDYCERVKQNLNGCNLEDKRLALDAFDVRVFATKEKVGIQLSVPLKFITIVQTSGCLPFHAYFAR